MAGKATTGETYQERTKGKDVRTSNIVAAKVSHSCIRWYLTQERKFRDANMSHWSALALHWSYISTANYFDALLGHCKRCENISRSSWHGQASPARKWRDFDQ